MIKTYMQQPILAYLVRMFRFIFVHGVKCFMHQVHSYAFITRIICQSLTKRASVALISREGLSNVRSGPILFRSYLKSAVSAEKFLKSHQ